MPPTTHPLTHLLIFMVFWGALVVFLVLYIQHLVDALNKLNRNATVLVLFFLGVGAAFIGVMLLAYFPNVDHDAGKGAAALGGLIIAAASMAFRSAEDPPRNPPPAPPPQATPPLA